MSDFYLFVLLSIFFVILPGPDIAITTKNTVSGGRHGGFKTMLGIGCALLIHTTAAILGLSALILKSAMLFSVVKYIGAVYLLYIGVRTLWALRKKQIVFNEVITAEENKQMGSSLFTQGFLTSLLNPKVALLFLTMFPQFIQTNNQSFIPFLIMGVTYTALTILWSIVYIILINQMMTLMKKPKTQQVIEGVTGAILIAFGLKLFMERANH